MPKPFILIAEDSSDDYQLLEMAIHRAALAVNYFRVHDGREAQAYLLGENGFMDRARFPLPHLILADVKMPCMDGMELLNWLRSQDGFKRIPFVFLSASGASQDVNNAFDLFANSYLVKPGRYDDLVQMVKDVRRYWLELNQNPS
jgi:CheY-like chemotaxis protein